MKGIHAARRARMVLACIATATLVAGCDAFVSAEEHIDRARGFMASGDYRSASIELKNALQDEPESAQARRLLAEVSLWLGDIATAESEFRKAGVAATDADAVELAVRLDLANGRVSAALEQLNADAGGLLAPARAAFYRGMALLGSGNAVAAESELQHAEQLDSAWVEPAAARIDAVAAQGKSSEALALAADLVRRFPESAWASYTQGAHLARVGELKQAVPALDRARERMSQQLDVLQQAAVLSAVVNVKLATGDLAGARSGSDALALLVPGAPVSRLLASRVKIAEGDYVGAAADLRRVVNAVPGFVPARFLLAVALLAQGNLEQASQQLNEIITLAPQHLESRQLLAQVRMRLNDPDGALRTLVPAIEAVEGNSNAAAGLAEAVEEMASGNTAAAQRRLEQLRRDNPASVEVRLMLARLALASDDARRAAELIDEAVKVAPGRGDVRNSAGLIYLGTGRFDQALTHFLAATELSPRDAVPWLNLGRAQLALEQLPAARASLNRALELRPRWVAAAGTLAFLELQSGQTDAAAALAAEIKEAWPRDAAAHEIDGEIRMALRQHAAAADSFLAAMALQPESPGYAVKAYRARQAGQLERPLEPLENWVAAHPGAHSMRAFLAEAYLSSGENRKAAAEYEALVAAQPDHAPTLNNLAWVYHELGDARAVDTARAALAKAPGTPAIMDTLGWILVQSGDPEEGLSILREAARLAADEPEIQFHYGAALAGSGAREQARLQLQRTLDEFPRFPSRPEAERLLADLGR